MKRFYFILLSLTVLCASVGLSFQTTAQSENNQTEEANRVSPNIVISQFYGGGGNSGAPFRNDYVELFNRGSQPISLNGWSMQYASDAGTNWLVTPLSNFTLQPGQYYLIQYASNGTVGNTLPTPDLIAPAVTVGGNTFIPNLSGTTGKLALSNSAAQLPASNCPITEASIIDFVGYGNSASCSEGTRTPNLSVTTAGIRNSGGCVDTDNNIGNFTIAAPAPRNSSTPTNVCSGIVNPITANGSANPNTVSPNGATTLMVRVFPADVPASTGITVIADLTNIGGAANQQFYDDGTNGDLTVGDNIFSYLFTVPSNANGGTFTVSGTATDAQMRSANVNISLTINASVAGEDYLLLGNPTNATADVANENNYLMNKPQYSLSYNRSRAIPNWVAWRLDTSWIGSTDRQDDFRPDTTLPAGWYQVTGSDYQNSTYGFDRGHHTPSGDRTNSTTNNSATFLMTNMMPQAGGNNQGPWNDLEIYCRELANAGNELYIVTGGTGQGGTSSRGFFNTINVANTNQGPQQIVVPAQTWKVILVLPNGTNDLQRINNSTRTFAVIMPNVESIRNNSWETYTKTVDQVETLTGYNFFSNVPANIQAVIEGGSPTAAAVSIGGRVSTPQDLGLTNALVTLTDSQGNSQTVVTKKFGNFRFTNLTPGAIYVLTVSSKRYQFAPQIITPNEDVTDLVFAP